ncbi:MAG: GTP 3',8-cyclase MoaA [Theionarchaea archaeon]|nr:GTP 3',8-cyclase MoaA [Theionarchaea archaeon]
MEIQEKDGTSPLKDTWERPVTSMRISVTQRCNLHCFYCHNEGELSSHEEMRVDQIEALARVASSLGIRKTKLTGGEPLMRHDIEEIVAALTPWMDDVSLTTNGTLLAEKAHNLAEAGLNRVNISIDSLNEQTYQKITGAALLPQVLEGLEEAMKNHLLPVKINVVVSRYNINEIQDFIPLLKKDMVLQLIEMINSPEYIGLEPIEQELAKKALKVEQRSMHKRRKYFLPQEVEIVRSMHNTQFCRNCTRIRVTSDGHLKPCLLRNDNLVPIPFTDDHAIKEAFRTAVKKREPYWR